MNLVTGGAGFIGSHLVGQLVEAGRPVRVLERHRAPVDHLPLDRIELVRGDIRDERSVREATRGCEYVYHLAADPNLWRRERDGFEAVNHVGAVQVMRAALENGARRVLHTSTESILTSPEFEGGPVETVRFREKDMLGPYCRSKYRAEEAAFRLAAEGAPVVVVSPTLPVGPGDRHQTPPTRMSVAFCRGELPAYLECRFNLVDARDVARGMILAMDRGRTGIRYLLGGENYRLTDWLRILGEEVGRSLPKWKVPYAVALMAAWGSEWWANQVTGKMPMATVTGVRLTRRCMQFDPSASLAELGLEPRPIRESARDAVAWYRQLGWV
ncbi:MAG: NAD-dependent epimerase/dehydratase family protein [Verrucomicrobiae bacterium]|nr:NAD-dependent epimerase/dehydratase family protein [Verrucomicrobiae bacterium]